jgi:hypothetical protein
MFRILLFRGLQVCAADGRVSVCLLLMTGLMTNCGIPKTTGSGPSKPHDGASRGETQPGAVSLNDRSGIPAWIPVYPHTTPQNLTDRYVGIERYVVFDLVTSDSCRDTVDYYRRELGSGGFDTHLWTVEEYPGNLCEGLVRANGPGRRRTVNMTVGTIARDAKQFRRVSVEAVERSGH